MPGNTARSVFFSVIGILIAGGCGGVAGWTLAGLLDLSGVVGALVAAAVGMVVATSVWVALTVLLEKAGMLR